MKKVITLGFMIMATVVACAQNYARRTDRIGKDEGPVAIRVSFEKDFGNIDDGFWSVYYEIEKLQNRISAKPIWYSFSRKTKSQKSEVRYSPAGEVLMVKGFNKNVPPVTPT